MSRPAQRQIDAASRILRGDGDADGSKAMHVQSAYDEWGAGIAVSLRDTDRPGRLGLDRAATMRRLPGGRIWSCLERPVSALRRPTAF
jgi:hypothetical protein